MDDFFVCLHGNQASEQLGRWCRAINVAQRFLPDVLPNALAQDPSDQVRLLKVNPAVATGKTRLISHLREERP